MSFTVQLKSKARKMARAGAKAVNGSITIVADPTGPGFTWTLDGTDTAGDLVDISAVADASGSVDDPTIMSLDPLVGGVTGHCVPLKVGTAKLSVTGTWKDGSIGPFSDTLTCVVTQGPVTGVVVSVNGTPVVPVAP